MFLFRNEGLGRTWKSGGERTRSERIRSMAGEPDVDGSPRFTCHPTFNDGKYSVGPSIQLICTRCCLAMTNMIQVCRKFHSARASIMHTRPDEIARSMAGEPDVDGRPRLTCHPMLQLYLTQSV